MEWQARSFRLHAEPRPRPMIDLGVVTVRYVPWGYGWCCWRPMILPRGAGGLPGTALGLGCFHVRITPPLGWREALSVLGIL